MAGANGGADGAGGEDGPSLLNATNKSVAERPAKLKRKKSIKSDPKGGKFKRGNSAMGIVVAKEREVALKIRESSSRGKPAFTVTFDF